MYLGACPLCSSEKRRRWLRRPDLELWLCACCGLGYSDPQPLELVEGRYLLEYDLAAHFGALEERKGTLIARRVDRLPQLGRGRRLLDVGCADGQFAAAAQREGWEAHGVELNPPAAARARERGIVVHEGRLEPGTLPAASFDLVTAWDVVEHVPDPRAFLAEVARLTAPGGTVVITTLNRRSLVARALGADWSMVAADHFTYWDQSSLARLVADAGLQFVRGSSFGLGRDFVAWIDRRPTRGGGASTPARRPSWDAHPLVLSAEAAANRLLDASGLGVGLEIVATAPHPRT